MIYHIVSRVDWGRPIDQDQYSAPSLKAEGFIHCSTREQALAVANDFYRGQRDLLLLCIDESKLTAELRWEAPAHPNPAAVEQTRTEALLPHIYGALNLEAVVQAREFREGDRGFQFPPDLPE